MKTYSARPTEVERKWWIVDAEGLVLGRLAAVVADRLRGKHKPMYTPHIDCGDHGVVLNADDDYCARMATNAQAEQLGIISRLACAMLIDPADGVPVIIDDALGYTDPERLASMGAVLGHAGRNTQVIVLTCTPQRYQGVGGAHLVAV